MQKLMNEYGFDVCMYSQVRRKLMERRGKRRRRRRRRTHQCQ